jgi:hypothetical protein
VALSATFISSGDSLKLINPEDRNCMFEKENSALTIYKNYTQSNCYFECFYNIAQEFVRKKYNNSHVCAPWFFPTPNNSPLICNPWEAVDFLATMLSVTTENCSHCLSDCSATIYKTHVTSVPLRNCHFINLGNSQLCNELKNPTWLVSTLNKDYQNRFSSKPYYIKKYMSSIRQTGRFKFQETLEMKFVKD